MRELSGVMKMASTQWGFRLHIVCFCQKVNVSYKICGCYNIIVYKFYLKKNHKQILNSDNMHVEEYLSFTLKCTKNKMD